MKGRLTTGNELGKLIVRTIVCTISIIPPIIGAGATAIDQFAGVIFLGLMIELFYLIVFFMPPSLSMLGLLYFVTRNPDKKIEYGSYGYLIGFTTGFVLLLSLFGLQFGSIVLLATPGFAAGIGLSFVSKRPEKVQYGAPLGRY